MKRDKRNSTRKLELCGFCSLVIGVLQLVLMFLVLFWLVPAQRFLRVIVVGMLASPPFFLFLIPFILPFYLLLSL